MALAKLTDLKARLEISGTAEDAVLTQILADATAAAERYCQRTIEYVAADRTDYLTAAGGDVYLPAWPVTAVTSVKESTDGAGDFAAADALVAGTDYRLLARRGVLVRLPVGTPWPCEPDAVQVVYRGGYNDPAVAPISGVSYPPQHIQAAVLMGAAELYKRRKDPGYKSAEGGQAGIQFGYAPGVDVLAMWDTLLADERRRIV